MVNGKKKSKKTNYLLLKIPFKIINCCLVHNININ